MRKPSVLVIFLTVFIDLIGFGIVLPLLPIYSKTFGATGWQIGALMASYSVMQFLFSPVWGELDLKTLAEMMLADRVPARLQTQLHKHIWGADVKGV